MRTVNTGILHNATPLTAEQIKSLEKQVLEDKKSFAYLNENSELCFMLPSEVSVIKELACNVASELDSANGKIVRKQYKKTGLKTFDLDATYEKTSIDGNWNQVGTGMTVNIYDIRGSLQVTFSIPINSTWNDAITKYPELFATVNEQHVMYVPLEAHIRRGAGSLVTRDSLILDYNYYAGDHAGSD